MAKDINELLNTDVEAIVAEGQKGFKRTKKKAILAIIIFIAVCAIAAGAYLIVQQVQKADKYNHAVELLEAGKYNEAAEFLSLNGEGRELLSTKEGTELLTEARNGQEYTKAQRYFSNGQYEEAQKCFEKLKDYKDSVSKALEAQYMGAMGHFDAGEYDIAIELFRELGDYADCTEKLAEAKEGIYQSALTEISNEEYPAAISKLELIEDYKDSDDLLTESKYLSAVDLMKKGEFTAPKKIFEELGDYRDSADLLAAYENSLSVYSGSWKYKSGTLLVSSNLQITVAESRVGSKEQYLLVETTDNTKKEKSDWTRIADAGYFYITSEGLKSGGSSPFGLSELKLIDDNTLQFIHAGSSGEYVRE